MIEIATITSVMLDNIFSFNINNNNIKPECLQIQHYHKQLVYKKNINYVDYLFHSKNVSSHSPSIKKFIIPLTIRYEKYEKSEQVWNSIIKH